MEEEETKSKSLSKMISVVISEKRIYLYIPITLLTQKQG